MKSEDELREEILDQVFAEFERKAEKLAFVLSIILVSCVLIYQILFY